MAKRQLSGLAEKGCLPNPATVSDGDHAWVFPSVWQESAASQRLDEVGTASTPRYLEANRMSGSARLAAERCRPGWLSNRAPRSRLQNGGDFAGQRTA
jgi:hypothetical protein